METSMKKSFAVLALAAGALAATPAFAWHHHHRHHHHGGSRLVLGFNFGVPAYYPSYYYPAPVYYTAPVVVQQAPTTYVERADPAPAPAANYWHYCAQSRAYYPYVKECPGGWQRVSPTPPG
jgi:hypothetical protein